MEKKEFILTRKDRKIILFAKLFSILTVFIVTVLLFMEEGTLLYGLGTALSIIFLNIGMLTQYLMTFGLDVKNQRKEWQKAQKLVSLEFAIKMSGFIIVVTAIALIISLLVIGFGEHTIALICVCGLSLFFRRKGIEGREIAHKCGYSINFKITK